MTERPKREFMAALREKRARLGLVRVEFWLTPEQSERVKRYVARMKRTGLSGSPARREGQ